MKILADFLRVDDADGWWEQRVQAALDFLRVEHGVRFEVRDLAKRVNAGVGAAGAMDGDGFLGDLADGVMDSTLDRWQAGLKLPAVEIGAVVGDG